MAIDLSSFITFAPLFLRNAAFLINLGLLVYYGWLAIFFGKYVSGVFREHISLPARIGATFVFGFLAVITGIGISWMIPPLVNDSMFTMVQRVVINPPLGGVLATLVLWGTLKLVSYHIFNIHRIEAKIKALRDHKKRALAIQKKEKKEGKAGLKHPMRLAGLVGFAVFLIVGLTGFQGFPNPLQELGMSEGDFENLADQTEMIQDNYGDRINEIVGDTEKIQECMKTVDILDDQSAIESAELFQDSLIEDMVEEYAGEPVTSMFRIDAQSGIYVLANTDTQACLATETTVCACQSI